MSNIAISALCAITYIGGYDKNEDKRFFKDVIGHVESNNNYKAISKTSSAIGKYQFLWNYWNGVFESWYNRKISKKEYLHNHNMQEDLMDIYIKKEVDRYIPILKKYNNKKLNKNEMRALIHFKGYHGAKQYLKHGKDVSRKNNKSIKKYLSYFCKKQ